MATEDFTTYTEADPNGHMTVTAPKVDLVLFGNDSDAWVGDSKGAAHFNGNFEHHFEFFVAFGLLFGGEHHPWAMANVLDSSEDIRFASGDSLLIQVFALNPDAVVSAVEITGGNFNASAGVNVSAGVNYFATVERDETIGTFGQLEIRIYTDSGRTNLLGSAQQLLTKVVDFEFVYGAQSRGPGSSAVTYTGYTQNLDLQQVALEGAATMAASGGIEAKGGLLLSGSVTMAGSGGMVADGELIAEAPGRVEEGVLICDTALDSASPGSGVLPRTWNGL